MGPHEAHIKPAAANQLRILQILSSAIERENKIFLDTMYVIVKYAGFFESEYIVRFIKARIKDSFCDKISFK